MQGMSSIKFTAMWLKTFQKERFWRYRFPKRKDKFQIINGTKYLKYGTTKPKF
jgi:hypothetical protein